MDTDEQPIQRGGLGPFFATLFLILPSAAAFACSYAFMHDRKSGVWFWYEACRPFGWGGVAMAILLFVVIALRGKTSRDFLIAIFITIFIGVLLLSLAESIYERPLG